MPAAEDAQGKVWISYNISEYLKDRYGLLLEIRLKRAVIAVIRIRPSL